MSTSFKDVHSPKANSPIRSSPSCRPSLCKSLHPLNGPLPITLTVEGMRTSFKHLQRLKDHSSIITRPSFRPSLSKLEHVSNALIPITLTVDGMSTSFKDSHSRRFLQFLVQDLPVELASSSLCIVRTPCYQSY
eukprot:scaffold7229_cov165-Cylindrotheca_fusiformis.AAC.2